MKMLCTTLNLSFTRTFPVMVYESKLETKVASPMTFF